METVNMLNAGRFLSRGKGRHGTRTIDSYELIYVDAGTLEMFEEERQFRLAPGDWLLLRPGFVHGGLAAYEPQLVFYWGHFLPRDEAGRNRLDAMPSTGHAPRPGRFGEYYRLLLSELRETGTGRGADLLTELLLEEAARTVPAQTEGDDGEGTGLPARAREYIKLHFEEELSAGLLAEALQCGPDYLNRLCRRAWGHTVTEEINRVRLARACRLLLEGKLCVKEVAYESGFNDPAYFRRRFRRAFGQTPGEYRQGHSLGHTNTE